jgi:hypothetical protein
MHKFAYGFKYTEMRRFSFSILNISVLNILFCAKFSGMTKFFQFLLFVRAAEYFRVDSDNAE